jgi:hypothetical protein
VGSLLRKGERDRGRGRRGEAGLPGCVRPRSGTSKRNERVAESIVFQAESSTDNPQQQQTISLDNYTSIVNNMSKSVLLGLQDGLTRMEVEFPPVLESDAYKNSSDIYIDANVQFAISLGRVLAEYGRTTQIIVPDANELRRSSKMFQQALDMSDNVSMGSLSNFGEWEVNLRNSLASLNPFENSGGQTNVKDDGDVDTYVVVNASCSELPDLKEFADKLRQEKLQEQGSSLPEGWEQYFDKNEGKPYYYDTKAGTTTWDMPVANEPAIILMNLELETLRGDLGLIAFPPKTMHWEFLSAFKPVYFIRQRDYSKTITESPYLVNYSGAIYREYPGAWQVLLEGKDSNRKYTPIQQSEDRYTLSQAKETMMEAMGLKTEEEGSLEEFFRRGYKTCTWWEDPRDYGRETSNNWRK